MSYDIKPYERSVFYYETDQMGIVHHSNYVRWMEEARLDMMSQVGWDYKALENEGVIIPVLSVSTEYKNMSYYGDTVLIYVKVIEYTGIRVKFGYDIIDKASGELRCVATSSHCLLDKNDNNKIMFIKKKYPEKDQMFKELLVKE